MTRSSTPRLPHDDHRDGTAHAVQEALARLRSELYAGRGPGISEAEWLANTSLRPAVGGVPTAASREALHLRTLRARGEEGAAAVEGTWAAAQFRSEAWGSQRSARSLEEQQRSAPSAGPAHTVAKPWWMRVAGWAAPAALWLRGRRRRRGEPARCVR